MGNAKKIMIAGGAGFIGSKTVNKLISLGYKVVVIDNLSTGQRKNISPKAKFYLGDIRNRDLVSKVFLKEKPDVVFNLAAKVYWVEHEKDPSLDVSTSVLGTINLLENCLKYKIKKFIFSSSISLYPHLPGERAIKETEEINIEKIPVSVFSYALAKYTAEQYVKYFHNKFGLHYIILRYAHVYGLRRGVEAGVMSVFMKRLIEGKPLKVVGGGRQFTDYVYIDDVVRANILAIQKGNNKIINIGYGRPITVKEIVSCFKKIADKKVKVEQTGEKSAPAGICIDISMAQRELSWKPKVSLEQGLSKIFNEYKN